MTRTGCRVKSGNPFFALVLLSALITPFIISASPFSVNGQLRVSGNQLVNECGSPVQLRGVSSHGLQWYGLISCFDFCCISTSAINYLANTVGIDIFRIAVYPEPNGYISNPSGFTQQVNNIVQMCEDAGIYALIDWHVLTPGDPNADIVYARTFWESMATAHKDSRNVIYEICNEPNGVSWTQIRTYANDIIPRIRAIDPDAVIVVGTPNWSQLGSEVVSNKLSYTNIMYTFHFYAASHDTSMLTNYVGQLPIFVTEWAATEFSGTGATDYTRADAFINIMQTNKISWCAWNWSEAPESSGMLNAGTCDTANWSSYKPTGSYVVGKVSNPADSFTPCTIATNTPTPLVVPTEVIPATDLRLDSMTDGDYVSNICSNWYSYDDSNDCTDKDCVANPHGTSQIVPWSKDHWQDLGRPVQNFYMQQPGHNGATDYAARITGIVTTTFLYGFAGLGFPLKEPEGPVDIHTATGLSFWCKSNQSRTFRLKINTPQAFAGRLDEDMYGYVFTASTSWQKVSIDFASILFSQEGWGNTLVTRAMALSAVDTIQWQTQGQTGAPYNFDLWVDDVVLLNAPAALKTIAAGGCIPTATFTRTATWDPSIPTYTFTPTPAYVMRVNVGGPSYTDSLGKVWNADQTFAGNGWGYEGGSGAADNSANPVAGTTDDTLYQTERWGNPTYRFNVPNGSYQVTFKFAEMYFTAANQRIFDVTIEGVVVIDNLDIVAMAGAKTAYDVTVIVNVTDNRLDITSSATVDGATFTAIQVVGYSAPPNTPTRTRTVAPTNTRTITIVPTNTLTGTPTRTITAAATYTRTATRTNTPLPSSTNTAVNTVTFTRTITRTNTPLPSNTNTPGNTATFTRTASQTNTPLPSGTNTPVNTVTYTRTVTRTNTPLPSSTNTPENTFTYTGTVTRTNTPYYSPTSTITLTYTATPTFTTTVTGTFTVTRTNTVSPTISQTWTGTPPTSTNTPTITMTSTVTSTPSNTRTPTRTWTNSATFTATPQDTATVTLTVTNTHTRTPVNTPVDTATTMPTATPENTSLNTRTPTGTPVDTLTGTPTAVNTAVNTLTNTPTVVDTYVDTYTETPTAVNTEVNTYTYTPTAADTAVNTFTRTPTAVNTPVNTFTQIATVVDTATEMPTSTLTFTLTLTITATASRTVTYTSTAVPTITLTSTPTRTALPTDAEEFEITDVIAYPNPYKPGFGIPFYIRADFSQKHSNLKVSIYTSALRCIRKFDFPDSPWAGTRILSIAADELAGLANGSYFYVITATNANGVKAKSKIPSLLIYK